MTAHISKSTTGYGVQVYQDHSDDQQFWYVPLQVAAELEKTLIDFKVDYWGIGPAYMVSDGKNIRSAFGAVLSGTANIDISDHQRRRIGVQIEREFNVKNPRLAPLRLRSMQVKPVFADKTLQVGTSGDVQFPNNVQFATNFSYLIGTGNSLFANYVAAQGGGVAPITNPGFGVNIDAKAEFRGEPWVCTIKCDLSSVWSEIRKSISGSARYGWFKIGSASYNSIITRLEREKIIDIKFDSGSLDLEKYGAQIFEMGKKVAEAINAGQGGDFFQFEPNPDQGGAYFRGLPKKMLFGGPWSVSINASYSERSFTQKIKFQETLTYNGNFEASVPSSMPLAVVCNNATRDFFNDLASEVPCATPDKVSELQERLRKAVNSRDRKLNRIMEALLDGRITPEVYNILKADIESRIDEDLAVNNPVMLHDNIIRQSLQGTHYVSGFLGTSYYEEIGDEGRYDN